MSKDKNINLIEIRTFSTMDEITSLDEFKENNPVSKENYESILGDYHFDEKVKCCVQNENEGLCNTEHNWGFVAKLVDGTLSIIGNDCAKNKFGADAKFNLDRSRYINEKRRRDRYDQLTPCLLKNNLCLNRLNALKWK